LAAYIAKKATDELTRDGTVKNIASMAEFVKERVANEIKKEGKLLLENLTEFVYLRGEQEVKNENNGNLIKN
jgi:DNA-binding transcriptional regulator YhcF (GntR family)